MRWLAVALVTLALGSSGPSLVARVPTGKAPCGAAAGFGGLWVANDGSGTLVRIDPRRNRVDRRIVVGRGACTVAVGAGAIWIARYRPDELVRVDARTGSVRDVAAGHWAADVAVAAGSVWVSAHDEGTVTPFDPSTLDVVSTIRVGGHPTGLAARNGLVWVGGGGSDTWVSTIDPASERATRIEVGSEAPAWFARGTGDVWVTTAGKSIVRLDAGTHAVEATIAIPRTPAGAAAARGHIWVADKERSTLTEIDPATDEVARVVDAGPGAYAVRAAFGSLWVTSYAGRDVWRFRPS